MAAEEELMKLIMSQIMAGKKKRSRCSKMWRRKNSSPVLKLNLSVCISLLSDKTAPKNLELHHIRMLI